LVEEHIRNFLDCRRARYAPNCEVHHGERAARVALMAAESYRKRRQIRPRRV
jgi:hypothetical protein